MLIRIVNNLGLMIGKYFGDNFFRFQYQGGFCSFWGNKRTDNLNMEKGSFWYSNEYQSRKFLTVGILFKLGFKIVPLPMLSIEFGKINKS